MSRPLSPPLSPTSPPSDALELSSDSDLDNGDDEDDDTKGVHVTVHRVYSGYDARYNKTSERVIQKFVIIQLTMRGGGMVPEFSLTFSESKTPGSPSESKAPGSPRTVRMKGTIHHHCLRWVDNFFEGSDLVCTIGKDTALPVTYRSLYAADFTKVNKDSPQDRLDVALRQAREIPVCSMSRHPPVRNKRKRSDSLPDSDVDCAGAGTGAGAAESPQAKVPKT